MVVAGGIWLFRTNFADYEVNAASFEARHLQLVASKSGIVLPPDCRGQNLLWNGRQSIDPSFLAKIEISESSANDLVNRVALLTDQKLTNKAVAPDVTWWLPNTRTTVVERTFQHLACYVHVIVCREGDRWMLYVEWVSV